MIVGKQKTLEEIWDIIKDCKKILVFGCNTCVAVCHEGGNKEAEVLGSILRMKSKQEGSDTEITDSGIERQCEHEYFEQAAEAIESADAILSIACGAGIQFLGEKFPHKIILPGLNTTFIGVVDAPGEFSERCLMCGDCILHLTGGICPITRCSKSIMNGPCGGSHDGLCEIAPDVPCAWHLIYERLEKQGRLDLMTEFIPFKNWLTSRDGGPRKQSRPDIMTDDNTAGEPEQTG
ncbi:MAG: methylenetetrahydrofolate reductase C-terminal domain-containing protein [Deltaproteobacteria bacterium]|nr:methylenetetrahydrofolate reductase C-terminal domain-containing protein [Deltaproteobacteria bacterium]